MSDSLARRSLLAAIAPAVLLSGTVARAQASPFVLPPLPYDPAALEPVIGRETMMLHHGKHHQAYVDGLNRALAPYPALQGRSAEDLLASLPTLPEPIRAAVQNNGGGHVNHSLFWQWMRPGGTAVPAALQAQIDTDFGSLAVMRTKFEEAGLRRFGSGWVFLAYDAAAKRLEIMSTPNQDTMPAGKTALLGNDVWEHAYYLTYRNRRADYLAAWWAVVDWEFAGMRLASARAAPATIKGDRT